MAKDPSHPAPGGLEVVRQFVNTEDVYGDEDLLAHGSTARRWLEAHRLVTDPDRIDDASLAVLRRLRAALRDLAIAKTTGNPPPTCAIHEINTLASGAGVRPDLTALTDPADQLASTLVPMGHGVNRAVAILTAAVHDAVHDRTWQRLKACANPECTWLFYDSSRSRTGRWCSMRACGDIMKARAYRARGGSVAGR